MINKKKMVFRWLTVFMSLLVIPHVYAVNILDNGGFDDGMFPWEPPGWWAGGAGESTVDERGRFCTTVTALGTADWGAQLRQNELTFVAGETYDISLRAWSSTPLTLPLSAAEEEGEFVWIFGADIAIDAPLAGDGQLIEMSFTASADSELGRFRILMGGGEVPLNETVCFDDIVVDGPAPNLIENSTFDEGYAPWTISELGGAIAHPTTEGGRFCLLAENPGPETWSLQFRNDGLRFIDGREYIFNADAWSSAPVNLEVSGVDESTGFIWHFGQNVVIDAPLDGEPQRLQANFVNAGGDTENGAFRFLLGNGHVPAGTTVCFDNVELLDPSGAETPSEPPPPPVHVNSHGYLTGLNKIATYVPPVDAMDTVASRSWTLFSGEIALLSGITTYHGLDEGSGDQVHHIDFSEIQTEGDNYTVAVTEGATTFTSQPFAIASDLYESLKYDALSYFYHNRSGTPILAEVVGETWARPAGHPGDAAVQTIECLEDATAASCRTFDASGGWYDAGDHGKYVVNGGISVWTLLNQYERAQALGSDLAEFGDGTMALPAEERSNGIPDLLDEARWEIEWFLKMQVPADFPLAGMVYHKMHSESWTGIPTAPHVDDVTRYVHPPSTTATLNFAAVTAQCYRVFKDVDDAFANSCLDAAKVAYAAAKANDFIPATNNGNGGGTYGDGSATDEFYWAATELYLATGEQSYAADMQVSPFHLYLDEVRYAQSIMGWPVTQALGLISLSTVGPLYSTDEDWVHQARQELVGVADLYVEHTQTEGYGLPMWTSGMYWGSNSNVTNNMLVLGLAHDFTCDDRYLEAMHSSMNYLLGNNPLGTSYISGYGERDLNEPHHRFWAHTVNADFPPPPPGAIAGGPNAQLEDPIAQGALQGCDPLKCYIDHWESYSTNEVTINWNAPLAWAAAYLDQWSDPQLQSAAQGRCQLRNDHFSSFEDDSRNWSKRGPAQISVVDGGTRGEKALEVSGCGYTYLDSPTFTTTEFEILGDRIAVDVQLPEIQDNEFWVGDIAFHLTLPDADIHNEWIGGTGLTGNPLGAWFTTSVELPAFARTALEDEHTGFITVAINTNNCAAPLMLDNVRFMENTHGR